MILLLHLFIQFSITINGAEFPLFIFFFQSLQFFLDLFKIFSRFLSIIPSRAQSRMRLIL